MTNVHLISGRRIPRVRRTDQVVSEIMGWVVKHDLKSGDRLPPEHELVEMLGCSRGTIREALKILEYQGIVTIFPGSGGGARISGVTFKHANEFLRNYFYFKPLTWESVYLVRERIEPLLAQQVVGKLSDDDFSALEATISLCEDGMVGKISESEHRQAELEFHFILARACTDPMLHFLGGFICDLLGDFVETKNVFKPQKSEFAEAALDYHKRLLEAFRRADAEGVHELMSLHMHDARCQICALEGGVDRGVLLQGDQS